MRTLICLSALLLAACDDAAPNNVAEALPLPPSAIQNQVVALDEGGMNALLIRAIRDADHDCQGVIAAKRGPDGPGGAPFWAARCTDRAEYGVLIGRDGIATVTAAARQPQPRSR